MFRSKGNKYNNKKSEKYGRKWDSKLELQFYEYLMELKEAGDVVEIECQPVFLLQDKFEYMGKNIRKIEYKADFKVVYSNGDVIVWDCKGMPPTADFKIKFKIVKYLNREMDFRCVKYYKKEWVEVKL